MPTRAPTADRPTCDHRRRHRRSTRIEALWYAVKLYRRRRVFAGCDAVRLMRAHHLRPFVTAIIAWTMRT